MKSSSKLHIIILLILQLLSSCAADNAMRKAEKFEALGEYFDAGEQYKKAYSKTPSSNHQLRGERALKMAKCYDHIANTQKALAGYKNAVRYGTATAQDRLAYARLLLKNGEYKNALNQFELLQDSLPNNILVKNGIISAQNAPQWKKNGSNYTVKKMAVFNSRRDDYSPVLAGDQYERIYFSSTRNDSQGEEISGITGALPGDIYFSEKDDKGKWSKPQSIESGLNTEDDEGACCLSIDGSKMYLTQCGSDPDYPRYAQIVEAPRADAAWGKASPVVIANDTLSSYAHPAVSPDGEWLYFVSDMPGGKGGLDIWRARLSTLGTTGVENLGEPINTPGNEMFPTFRPNGDFYFSSDGHPGMGGLDIFIATVGKDGKYKLEHPGYPLNSQGDDFGMTFEGQLNRGFFSSSRGDGRGWDHIYSFDNPEIVQTMRGWVYEQDGYALTNADVRIVGSDGTYARSGVKGDGSFEFRIEPDVDYIILASCNGYLNHKEELRVDTAYESEIYDLQFALPSLSTPVLIDNIFYEFNKATLLPESAKALDSLVQMLNDNPNITIELSAHTDYKGSDEYNLSLSQRRAESCVNYLIAHGIAPDRLTPKGYGESRPKKIRRKVAEKYPWLKEGDILKEDFITKLKTEQQETANALNRRTEFTVLRTTYDMFDENGNLKNPPKPQPKKTDDDDDSFEFEL